MKVLVLSGRFGMGHEMAANAICEQFRKLDKDTEIVKKDLLEELYPHISKLIFWGFRLMVEHCHGIYNFIYKMSGKMKVEMQPRGAAIYKKLKKINLGGIIMNFQDMILALQSYWSKQGCIMMQPYDVEKGAGTMNPNTILRSLGPEPWSVCYVEPSRRPADGRYGENPNRLYQHHQLNNMLLRLTFVLIYALAYVCPEYQQKLFDYHHHYIFLVLNFLLFVLY